MANLLEPLLGSQQHDRDRLVRLLNNSALEDRAIGRVTWDVWMNKDER